MQLKRCLRHLLPKKVPWLQGARPLDDTHCVQCLCEKKGAANKFLVPKKAHACSRHLCATTASLRQHAKTLRCSERRRVGISRSKPSINKDL